MEAGSPGLTDRESGVWVSTMAPLDPKGKRKYKIIEKIYKIILELSFSLFQSISLFFFQVAL